VGSGKTLNELFLSKIDEEVAYALSIDTKHDDLACPSIVS